MSLSHTLLRGDSPFPFPIFEKKQKCDFTIPMAEHCHSQAQHCNQSSRTRNEKTKYFYKKINTFKFA